MDNEPIEVTVARYKLAQTPNFLLVVFLMSIWLVLFIHPLTAICIQGMLWNHFFWHHSDLFREITGGEGAFLLIMYFGLIGASLFILGKVSSPK